MICLWFSSSLCLRFVIQSCLLCHRSVLSMHLYSINVTPKRWHHHLLLLFGVILVVQDKPELFLCFVHLHLHRASTRVIYQSRTSYAPHDSPYYRSPILDFTFKHTKNHSKNHLVILRKVRGIQKMMKKWWLNGWILRENHIEKENSRIELELILLQDTTLFHLR